jgi:hypothetical protein
VSTEGAFVVGDELSDALKHCWWVGVHRELAAARDFGELDTAVGESWEVGEAIVPAHT